MKRTLIAILIVFIAVLGGCTSKSGTYTPPIATPNQNLPLYESGNQDATGGGDPMGETEASPSSEDSTKVLITADPSTIHRYAYGSSYNSKITVEDGVFEPNSVASIWGEVEDADDVTSPPQLYDADLDATAEKVQLGTNSSGGIEFWIRAGNSTGTFTINVSDGNKTLSTLVTIIK